VTRDEIQKLIGGYATGSLTESERKLLFDAALEDQELFDQLAHEQALKELLEVPGAKQRLLTALEPEKPSRAFWKNQWPWALAAATASVIIAIGLVRIKTAEKPVEIAAVTKPAESAPVVLKDQEADAVAVSKTSNASPAPAPPLREKRKADQSVAENTVVRQAEPTVVASPPPAPPPPVDSLKKEAEAVPPISQDSARAAAPPPPPPAPQVPPPAVLGFRADQTTQVQGAQVQTGQLQPAQAQQGIQTAQSQERSAQQGQSQQVQPEQGPAPTQQAQIQGPEVRVLTLTPSATKASPGVAAGKGGGGRGTGGGAFAAPKAKAAAPFAFDYSFDGAGALRIVPMAQGFLLVSAPLQTTPAVLFPSRNVPAGTPVIVPIPAQASELVVSFSASPAPVTGVSARRDEPSGTVQDQNPPNQRIQVTIPVKR